MSKDKALAAFRKLVADLAAAESDVASHPNEIADLRRDVRDASSRFEKRYGQKPTR